MTLRIISRLKIGQAMLNCRIKEKNTRALDAIHKERSTLRHQLKSYLCFFKFQMIIAIHLRSGPGDSYLFYCIDMVFSCNPQTILAS